MIFLTLISWRGSRAVTPFFDFLPCEGDWCYQDQSNGNFFELRTCLTLQTIKPISVRRAMRQRKKSSYLIEVGFSTKISQIKD